MTNTWYASDWDQAYGPSYAKICRTEVRHIQVHLYCEKYVLINNYHSNVVHVVPLKIDLSWVFMHNSINFLKQMLMQI